MEGCRKFMPPLPLLRVVERSKASTLPKRATAQSLH
jgi:hypothetical protein